MEQSYPMGAICTLAEVLCWEKYGYWAPKSQPPEWFPRVLETAKHAAAVAKPADCKFTIEFHKVGSEIRGTFRVWDEANPWAEPSELNFAGYHSEDKARQHYTERVAEFIRLHSGSVDALLHYQQTGEPTLPAWAPPSMWYWLKSNYVPADRRC